MTIIIENLDPVFEDLPTYEDITDWKNGKFITYIEKSKTLNGTCYISIRITKQQTMDIKPTTSTKDVSNYYVYELTNIQRTRICQGLDISNISDLYSKYGISNLIPIVVELAEENVKSKKECIDTDGSITGVAGAIYYQDIIIKTPVLKYIALASDHTKYYAFGNTLEEEYNYLDIKDLTEQVQEFITSKIGNKIFADDDVSRSIIIELYRDSVQTKKTDYYSELYYTITDIPSQNSLFYFKELEVENPYIETMESDFNNCSTTSEVANKLLDCINNSLYFEASLINGVSDYPVIYIKTKSSVDKDRLFCIGQSLLIEKCYACDSNGIKRTDGYIKNDTRFYDFAKIENSYYVDSYDTYTESNYYPNVHIAKDSDEYENPEYVEHINTKDYVRKEIKSYSFNLVEDDLLINQTKISIGKVNKFTTILTKENEGTETEEIVYKYLIDMETDEYIYSFIFDLDNFDKFKYLYDNDSEMNILGQECNILFSDSSKADDTLWGLKPNIEGCMKYMRISIDNLYSKTKIEN